MNEHKLSARLQAIADLVPKNARLADIGSDHGYLPAWLVLNKKIPFAVAGEVVEGPYASARSLVASSNLQDKIDVRLGDGLEVITASDNIDVITIAGMGGSLIREILQRGQDTEQLTGQETLILQPNVGEYTLRRWLAKAGYGIIHEEILKEDDKIYEIIVAVKKSDACSYSQKELFFGPILLENQTEIFYEKWQKQLEKHQYILAGLKKAGQRDQEKISRTEEKIEWMKELLI
ncbi:tRNA (adenine(22)-N(1))-methyltransferase [Vagococcus elongatus]|uniref:SAM-dependent methyltransferase n=1 Tax=Vagococcus elongatus TaxID=180344 RepID=A0A430ALM5_9ENTE|nr:tRNA (adenine(22)-N(1))-methyltransferase TrmK [Vagococcus elongatus]RSU09008.1 SAM-dependent methyltransferase [Vagococcus elongatus]